MSVTASQLRQNIYQLLDHVIETGQPLEIERKGRRLRILPENNGSRLDKLPKRKCIKGDPEKLVSIDWSGEWKP